MATEVEEDHVPGHGAGQPWWGEYDLKEGEHGYWQVGPMTLVIRHAPREWWIAYRTEREANRTAVRVEVPHTGDADLEDARVTRYSFRHTDGRLRLSPLLADRPVISRPDVPLFIPPGEEVLLFVGSPLWFRIEANAARTPLEELPVFRPSDTWFGELSREGGLCYASNTRALSHAEEVLLRPHRAVTPVRICNRAKRLLPVERLNLPVPYLSLYLSAAGALWTQAVTLERTQEDEQLALLKLAKRAPPEAGPCTLLAAARSDVGQNLVFQAFSRIFSEAER